MKSLFPQHYRPTVEETQKLFDECIFIFDANMLLNLYRYPSKASEDLLRILQRIAELERIWLPFQAALEYQENRLAVIAEQKRKFGQVKKVIADIQAELRKKLDELQLRRRHSSIDPDVLLNEIDTAFQKHLNQLETFEHDQLDVHQEDKIRAEIDKIFDGRIGLPFSQAELNEIFNEGSTRYKIRQPPGYEDEKEKKDTFIIHEGIVIKREFGDLIIWKEIIRYINDSNPLSAVFITGDNKEDWWLQVSGKTISPRPELLSEIYSKTNVPVFHMYNSEKFMELASQYFGVQVDKDSIEQIKRVTEGLRSVDLARRARELRTMYGGRCQVCGYSEVVEITHIAPRYKGGASTRNNLLLLCPNHHRLFDRGSFTVDDNFHLIGISGILDAHPDHRIGLDNLRFHRENIFKG